MIEGLTRHDEEQILTRGDLGLPLEFPALVQGVSGHRASTTQPECQHGKGATGRLVWWMRSARQGAGNVS